MRMPRFRFSIRSLLIALTVFAAVLALSIQWGPHVAWRTLHSRVSTGVTPLPSQSLVAIAPNEVLVACQVGPVSFELPETLSRSIQVKRGAFLQFQDNGRSILLLLPSRDLRLLQEQIVDFPDKTKLTHPRLYKEIADAQSSDFSFGMSRRELAWHQWLLSTRSQIGINIDLIEYLWRPDLEGNLISFSTLQIFEWSTVDCQWEGKIYFRGMSEDDDDWIRHFCTTFTINGNLEVFKGRDDAAIESLITISAPVDGNVAR